MAIATLLLHTCSVETPCTGTFAWNLYGAGTEQKRGWYGPGGEKTVSLPEAETDATALCGQGVSDAVRFHVAVHHGIDGQPCHGLDA